MNNLNVSILFISLSAIILRLGVSETNENLKLLQKKSYTNGIKNVEKELGQLLRQLQKNQNVITRKVFIDDQEISIVDYFKSPYLNKSFTGNYVYELSHLTNIVLSCEYSDITYYYIKLIEFSLEPCILKIKQTPLNPPNEKLRKINKCFNVYNPGLLYFIREQITPMILTLAGLVRFTKNVVNKYHDIFRILLSWYTYIDQHFNTKNTNESYKERMSRVDSIIIVNFQMKSRLERFMVENCYHPNMLIKFKIQANNNIAGQQDIEDFNEFFEIIAEKLKPLTYLNFYGVKELFVINFSKSNFKKLITLIAKEISFRFIRIEWNGKKRNIRTVFNTFIKNNIDVETILKFEKLLFEIISEIIIGYELKILKQIMKSNNILNKSEKCNSLQDKINVFLKRLKNENQSIYLINNLLKINHDLSLLCFFMKSFEKNKYIIKDTIGRMNRLTNVLISKFIGRTEFGSFLQSLSEMVICAKLHPIISNSFWEQINSYSSSLVGHYVINYQSLHTKYTKETVNNLLCFKTSSTLRTLESIGQEMEICIGYDADDNSESNGSCFAEFNRQYKDVVVEIANIAVNTFPQYFLDWEKMLLTLIYNMKNIELFDPDRQDSLRQTHVQYLTTFVDVIKNVLSEYRYIECSCGALLSSFDEVGECPVDMPKMNNLRRNNTNGEMSTHINQLQIIPELVEVFKYEHYFSTVSNRVAQVLDKIKYGTKLKLFWDGTEKTLEDVHYDYKMHPFDIQDGYDYLSFFVKWIITIVYSMLVNIIDEMMISQYEPKGNEIIVLETFVEMFLKSDLSGNRTVLNLLPMLIFVIRSFNSQNADDLKNIMNALQDDFEFLNFTTYLVSTKDTVSNRIQMFLSDIKLLTNILFDSKID